MTASETEGTLLFDYYSAPLAIIGDCNYQEITINQVGDKFYLNVYSGSRTKGTTTSHQAYDADSSILKQVVQVVKQYKMADWNNTVDVTGMTGALYVVKFRGPDFKLIRVSTERFPKKYLSDIKEPFIQISNLLQVQINKSHQIF
jgi:hypothetical protein